MALATDVVSHRTWKNYVNHSKLIDIIDLNQYRNKRCFIIGGGESLKGFDLNRLQNDITIGINKSYMFFNSTFSFCTDSSFYEEIKHTPAMNEKWESFTGIKVFLAPEDRDHNMPNDIYFIRRTHVLELPNHFDDGINTFNNSGYGALVFAYLLGCNPVYLLGYSMRCVQYTHWHDGYAGQTLSGQASKMHSYMMPFILNEDQFKDRHTTIINLDPNSALDCFPKMTIDTVLSR